LERSAMSKADDFLRELGFKGIRGAVAVSSSLRGTNVWIKNVLESDRREIEKLLRKYGAEVDELEGGWVFDGF
jgi:phosphohistidine phosphatase SixA